jgi:hypothetical protein
MHEAQHQHEDATPMQRYNTNAKMQHQRENVAPTHEVATPTENNNINAKTQHQHETTITPMQKNGTLMKQQPTQNNSTRMK